MAQDKETVLNSVSNQQALVKALVKKKKAPRRIIIPGGKTMLDTLDRRNLNTAIYNWVRGVRWFSEMKLSFMKGEVDFETKTYRTLEFPESQGQLMPWDRPDIGGKRWLANILSDALMDGQTVVAIEVKEDGLYLTVPTNSDLKAKDLASRDDWEPNLEFITRGKGEYQF